MEDTATIVISADRHERLRQFFRDVWTYRELFLTFLQRDLKVRYKQTVMGAIWVVAQPLFTTAAYVLIFGKIANMPTDGLPVVLFYFAANVPWSSFARELTGATLSVENNSQLITKVYFPRLIVPIASVVSAWVDFLIGWVILLLLAVYYGRWSLTLVAVTPLLMLLQSGTSLGLGLVLAALNAQYRDVKNAISFLTQILMLATPVIYPFSKYGWAQPLVFLNPMATVITTYRDCLARHGLNWTMIGQSMVMTAIYLTAGFWFFRKRESRLADVL